jgi:hypothetical protein
VWGSWCIDPHFLDLSTSWRWVASFTPLPLYPQEKSSWYPLDRRLRGPQSRSGRRGENSWPYHSPSLYRLRYPGQGKMVPKKISANVVILTESRQISDLLLTEDKTWHCREATQTHKFHETQLNKMFNGTSGGGPSSWGGGGDELKQWLAAGVSWDLNSTHLVEAMPLLVWTSLGFAGLSERRIRSSITSWFQIK